MDNIVSLLNGLAPLVALLMGTGFFIKYVPFMKNVSNKLIPLLNALIALFVAFGGTAPVAHAGIFGDLGHQLSLMGRIVASTAVAVFASGLYERYIRPIEEKVKQTQQP